MLPICNLQTHKNSNKISALQSTSFSFLSFFFRIYVHTQTTQGLSYKKTPTVASLTPLPTPPPSSPFQYQQKKVPITFSNRKIVSSSPHEWVHRLIPFTPYKPFLQDIFVKHKVFSSQVSHMTTYTSTCNSVAQDEDDNDGDKV